MTTTAVIGPDSPRSARRLHRHLDGAAGGNLAWAAAAFGLAILVAGAWWLVLHAQFEVSPFGVDLAAYLVAASRWLDGGSFYPSNQLAGSYVVHGGIDMAILYPPIAIPLFVPFLVLPAVLWWAIPAVIVLAVFRHHRPRPAAWIVAALLVVSPTTSLLIVWTGNPGMWVCAAFALATVRPGFAPLILLKISLGPFALWGIRHREWWVGLGMFALACLAFLPLWPDYLAVVRNADLSPTYSLGNVPLMLVPVVAWLGRSRS